ncbi:MAG: gluconokinase [Chloroflexota bacterium]
MTTEPQTATVNVSDSVSPRDAEEPLVLALDAGTSSIRALVYDRNGRRVSGWEVHRPYAVETTADGGVTADAGVLFDLTVACIDDISAAVVRAGRKIGAVACDTFWHSLMGTDTEGNALTPIYTWADTRSSAAASELRRKLDGRAVHSRTGAELHSSYWPAKFVWLAQTEAELFSRVRYWMSFAEYLYLHLFGARWVSISMASGTGLFDQNACRWDPKVLSALPLEEDQLSPLRDFSDGRRDLVATYRARWPGLTGIPWYLPIGDGAANNVGSGGSCAEWVVVMAGTSGALRIVREAEHVEIPRGLWTYRMDARRFVQGGALSAGGNVWAWLMQTLGIEDVDALERDLLRMQPDAHGLTVLPFLAGERSPEWNPSARAAIVGPTLHTTREDIVRATLEGITYRFGLVYTILRHTIAAVHGIIGSGAGLIHSPVWMQMMTDVLGESITASAVSEASSRGVALLALEAMGSISSIGAAPVPLGERFDPVAEHTRIYRSALERQQRLHQKLTE